MKDESYNPFDSFQWEAQLQYYNKKYTKGQLKGILELFILLKNLYLIMSILLK